MILSILSCYRACVNVKCYGVGKNAVEFLAILEQRLASSTYIAGETFSIADITALCALDFARVIKIKLNEAHPNFQRWYSLVSSRPCASA